MAARGEPQRRDSDYLSMTTMSAADQPREYGMARPAKERMQMNWDETKA